MKHLATQWIRTLAIGVVLAGLMATPGPAQEIGGVKLEKWSTSPSNINQADITGILDNGTLFVDGVNAGWGQARGPACTQLRQALGKSDMIGRGVTLYNIDCRPAPAGSLQVRRVGDEIRIDYLLRGNTVQFTSTTPTLLGKYADPRVSVDFDLALAARIKIPSLTQPLVVESAVVQVQNSRVDSQNFPADVLKALAQVFAFFGGRDFKALAEAELNKQQINLAQFINPRLGPINQLLQQLGQQGFSVLKSQSDLGARKLVLRAEPPSTLVKVTASGPVKVRIGNALVYDPNGWPAGSQFDGIGQNFSKQLLSDVQMVPIQVEIMNIQNVYIPPPKPGQKSSVPTDEAPRQLPKQQYGSTTLASGVRTLDLVYNRRTRQISGSVTGTGGTPINIPSSGPVVPAIVLTIGDDQAQTNLPNIPQRVARRPGL